MTTYSPFHTFRNVKSLGPAVFALATLLMTTAVQAQVTSITETQLTALNPTDVPITGTPTNPPTSFLVYTSSVGGQTLTFSNGATATNGKSLQRRNQQGGSLPDSNFGGDFPVDTLLIDSVVSSNITSSADGLNIAFLNPVNAFGFNFDPSTGFAPTDFTFVVTEQGGAQTTIQRPGIINLALGNGNAPFFGVQDAGGNLITSVLVYGTAVTPGIPNTNPTPNDFAVGLLRFNTIDAVPEPGSIALLAGMAVTSVGCFARRKRILRDR